MEIHVISGCAALLQYGLYSSFMSCFVYIFLGSCKDITIGPTAIMGIMTNPFVVQNDNPDFAVLLCFLMGCVIVLVGLLRLGKSTKLISE
jgi:sodium-independent sulfate anion transporter 11